MNSHLFNINLQNPAREIIYCPVPEHSEGYILAQLAQSNPEKNILYITRDETNLVKLSDSLKFFLPDEKTILFPAWDCLPYDRVSPNLYALNSRIKALYDITAATNRIIVVTSINSVMQYIIPQEILTASIFTLHKGFQVNREQLMEAMLNNGFIRVSTASEAGEFAVRGSIIDIFPSSSDLGFRVDFFGDRIESIKTFDPETQITVAPVENFTLLPASEIIFSGQAIENFRINYRQLFGASSADQLYESISHGRRYPGIEHWLPLFYSKLDSLFDYKSFSLVVTDDLPDAMYDERYKVIQEYYLARKETSKLNKSEPYNPIEPDRLWLSKEIFENKLHSTVLLRFNRFIEDKPSVVTLPINSVPNFYSLAHTSNKSTWDILNDYLKDLPNQHVIITCYSEGSRSRLKLMLDNHGFHTAIINSSSESNKLTKGLIGLAILPLDSSFSFARLLMISEQHLIGERIYRTTKSRKKLENLLSEAASFVSGELVVHRDHGIGRFTGLETINVLGTQHDFLLIIYDGGDKLYIPVENIEVISRYGSDDAPLDKLGGTAWQSRKAKLKNRIKLIAEALLKTAAERELKSSTILTPLKGLYDEFCARFPYPETEDQLSAIQDIEQDLLSGKPMDRLICGDVGFGKTEVALRAAFIAAMPEANETTSSKGQVAVVVPTTLLARQHYHAFKTRFAGLPVKVGHLSRMVSAKEVTLIKKQLADGNVDIIIGTHALLAQDVSFHNLTLLIVDEEQHFGVSQKERLKQLRSDVHVLTLSATPIPRTLQMALTKIKELSLIATPPVDRMAVKTFVMPFDPVVIREAIMREYVRGGKSFYVCPRIADLAEIETMLKELVPEIKIAVAHGQMLPKKLDDIMGDFYDGKYDLLLSTSIIESGLDITSANTMIIHRADMFGLSQLYQLRGRVGRGKIRAYAYLTLQPKKHLNAITKKRLEIMQTLDSLGAGFSLASHDMDIRGFGNLVGDEQSGHIKEVGIELYQEMLQEAVEQARLEMSGETITIEGEHRSPQINIGLSVLIPDTYVSDLSLRLGLYKRAAALSSEAEMEAFASELIDRFGPLPTEANNLLLTIQLKQLCKLLNIEKLDAGSKGAVIGFYDNKFSDPDKLLQVIASKKYNLKPRSDQKLLLQMEIDDPHARLRYITKVLQYILTSA